MNWYKLTIWVLAALFYFMLGGAIVSHLLWHQAPLAGSGSAIFLFIAGVLVMVAAGQEERWRLVVSGLIGFAAEVIGVQFGWLFGRYSYTEVLAPNWLGTPLVMFCAWFILIGYVKQLLLSFRLPVWSEVGLGSLCMTVIDLLIDPLAAHPFNFWKWIETGAYYGIPLRNFSGWFIVSVLIFSVEKLVYRTRSVENPWIHRVGFGIVVLYTACAFGYSYYLAGLVGMGLCLMSSALIGAKTTINEVKTAPPKGAN